MEDKKVKNFRYFHANIDIPLYSISIILNIEKAFIFLKEISQLLII